MARPFPLEAVEDPIERLLRDFVPREAIAQLQLGLVSAIVKVELEIEELPAFEAPRRPLDFVRAEEVHAVFEVPSRVAGVGAGAVLNELQVLCEREHSFLGLEPRFDLLTNRPQRRFESPLAHLIPP